MADVLEKILTDRRRRLAEEIGIRPLAVVKTTVPGAPAVRDFFGAVAGSGRIGVIAEIKRKSPSAGPLRPDLEPVVVARAYERAGVAAISVLTEGDWFGGSLADLKAVRAAVRVPVLRKDFVWDAYQIWEAREAGADAVLLIADMLSAPELGDLLQVCREAQIEPLVEVFSSEAAARVKPFAPRLVGVNTRNLRTLEMDADRVMKLLPELPAGSAVVAESGVKSPEDVRRWKGGRVRTVLVGESLMRENDIEVAARRLVEAGS